MSWNFENSYSRLPSFFYTSIHPVPVKAPKVVKFNEKLAVDLGLDPHRLKENGHIFAGNTIPDGAMPLAQAYAGHQFGHFTMLGDGRAVLLGEQLTPNGRRFDIQLKGSGRTPYSRGGDGRAALGPMLREYTISEAMEALGIPTTRSLAVVTTGETVYREKGEIGAILTRVAKSHIRVGTFEYAAAFGEVEDVKALADYTLERHYPHYEEEANKYIYLLKEVIKVQASLIAKWQSVGFIHGVMNTDNMTISGETIDYGPCAFMDAYDPMTVFSSIDRQGRYANGNQPKIAVWNLARFAETLLPLFDDKEEVAVEKAREVLDQFENIYYSNWLLSMRAKLGIFNEQKEDEQLVDELLEIMKRNKADFTNTFRQLATGNTAGMDKNWIERWEARLKRQEHTKEQSQKLMKSVSPAVIPRNHLVEEALLAAVEDDYTFMDKLLSILQNPFNDKKEKKYCIPAPPSSRPYRTFCGT